MAFERQAGSRTGGQAPRPPQPLLPRDRLVDRLCAIPAGCGVAMVMAPAGSGVDFIDGMKQAEIEPHPTP